MEKRLSRGEHGNAGAPGGHRRGRDLRQRLPRDHLAGEKHKTDMTPDPNTGRQYLHGASLAAGSGRSGFNSFQRVAARRASLHTLT